jgi:hypothetical protein
MASASSPIIEVSSDPAAWIAILAAVIATLGTVVAAIVAARSAKADKRSELQTRKIAELENRISDRKYEIYKPMIEMLGEVLRANRETQPLDSDEIQKLIHEFSVWVSIYGSDDAVTAFHRFQQAAFNDVPSIVSIRLYAELVLAARRDIARSDTQIRPLEIIGMRVTDIYTDEAYYLAMTEPFDKLCERYNWIAPWSLRCGNRDEKAGINSSAPPLSRQ